MTASPSPAPLEVSSGTHTLFTARGTSILWDASHAQFIRLKNNSRDILVEHSTQLSFEGEELEDITTFGEEVFLLTKRPVGTQWSRPWKRRPGSMVLLDGYRSPMPLCAYIVRAFSVDGAMQIGETLHLEQRGVAGLIHAGPHRVIVKTIGHECIASVWLSPLAARPGWLSIYSELTWDPNIIATKIGFKDAEEELEYLQLEHLESDGDPKDVREEFSEEETLDYAFLTDSLIVRFRELARWESELELWLEVFDLSSAETNPTGFQTPPILLKLRLPWKQWSHVDVSDSYLSTEPTFSSRRCLSVCIHNTGFSSLILLDANRIRDHALQKFYVPAIFQQFCYHTFEDDAPFTICTTKHLAPPTWNGRLIFPAFDLDSSTAHPTVPRIRFVRFTEGSPIIIDIPVSTLIPCDELCGEFLEQRYTADPQFVVSWDGSKTLCVVFRWTMLEGQEASPLEHEGTVLYPNYSTLGVFM
ncbi:hypothetical protein B0H19DRAFT_1274132 [Mycena capillaripes]|nr:hypothetical protein B0H19DRAFT_1274132 [Mycena capillaripes]